MDRTPNNVMTKAFTYGKGYLYYHVLSFLYIYKSIKSLEFWYRFVTLYYLVFTFDTYGLFTLDTVKLVNRVKVIMDINVIFLNV